MFRICFLSTPDGDLDKETPVVVVSDGDNRFYEPMGRFPEIEEDEPPYRLLCNEYPTPGR